MTISQRIFLLLKEKKLKQKDLALKTGISESAVSDWKKKGTNPAAENISAIADFLNVSIDYLLTGNDKTLLHSNLTSLEQECLNKFNRLSEIDKGRMLDRMETIYDTYSPEQKGNAS